MSQAYETDFRLISILLNKYNCTGSLSVVPSENLSSATYREHSNDEEAVCDYCDNKIDVLATPFFVPIYAQHLNGGKN